MALTITYAEVRREIGRFLSMSEDPTKWDSEDTTRVADIIKRGSRRFYFPEPGMIEDEALIGHDWSFIQDALSVSLSSGTQTYDLPSDFLRLTERPSISGGDLPLEEITETELRNLVNSGAGVGKPQYYTIKRETPSSADLLYQIRLYPVPTETLTLEGWYLFDPPVASSSQDPVVPSNHVETYLAALMMTADELLNRESDTEGKMIPRFKSLLAASILYDQSIGSE